MNKFFCVLASLVVANCTAMIPVIRGADVHVERGHHPFGEVARMTQQLCETVSKGFIDERTHHLLEHGANPNAEFVLGEIEGMGYFENATPTTPFIVAIAYLMFDTQKKQTEIEQVVDLFLRAGGSSDTVIGGISPACAAVGMYHLNYILGRGVEITERGRAIAKRLLNNKKLKPEDIRLSEISQKKTYLLGLHVALQKNDWKTVCRLAKPKRVGPDNPIFWRAVLDYTDPLCLKKFRMFLERGGDPQHRMLVHLNDDKLAEKTLLELMIARAEQTKQEVMTARYETVVEREAAAANLQRAEELLFLARNPKSRRKS